MTEGSEARWDPPPIEPLFVATALEAVFLTEEERALVDADLKARSRRAPIGFAPRSVSSATGSHRRNP